MTETKNKYKLNNNTSIKIAITNEFGESKIRKILIKQIAQWLEPNENMIKPFFLPDNLKIPMK